MNIQSLSSNSFLFFEVVHYFSVVDAFEQHCSDDYNRHHEGEGGGDSLAGRSPSEEMSPVYLVVALNHAEHVSPPVSQVFELVALDV
jgi:hypothetical protein